MTATVTATATVTVIIATGTVIVTVTAIVVIAAALVRPVAVSVVSAHHFSSLFLPASQCISEHSLHSCHHPFIPSFTLSRVSVCVPRFLPSKAIVTVIIVTVTVAVIATVIVADGVTGKASTHTPLTPSNLHSLTHSLTHSLPLTSTLPCVYAQFQSKPV